MGTVRGNNQVLHLLPQIPFISAFKTFKLNHNPGPKSLVVEPYGVGPNIAKLTVFLCPCDRTLRHGSKSQALSRRRKKGQEMRVDRRADVWHTVPQ